MEEEQQRIYDLAKYGHNLNELKSLAPEKILELWLTTPESKFKRYQK